MNKKKDLINQIAFENRIKDLFFEILSKDFPISFYWMDSEGVLGGCNDKVLRDLKISRPELFIGQHVTAVTSQEAWNNCLTVMQSHKTQVMEEKHVIPNAETTYYLSIKSPVFNESGSVEGLLGLSIDISDRKKQEQQLLEAKEKAELANKTKEQFLYNMRHDIRTPFAGISGLSDMLRRGEGDPKKQKYLEAIYASSEQLLNYLNEILELAQIEDGEIPLVSHAISLKEVAQSCVDMYLPAMKENQLHFSFDYDKNLPEYLQTDEFRLKRILINLIGNAVKFTPAGSIDLRVALAKKQPSEDHLSVIILVKDTGIGIPKEQQKIVFEKFRRLTPSYQGKYKGSGLGLFAVKTLIKELQGTISLESEQHQGSTFTCVIPMKKVDNATLKSFQALTEETPIVTYSTSKISARILLVEDMPIIQMATTSLLEELNCNVTIADSGEKALQLFKSHEYDLIFMDIGLPDIDGYEVAKKIRASKKGKNIPILALTAHAADDVDDLCGSSGMNAVLQKPLKREHAKELLNTYVYKNLCSQHVSRALLTPNASCKKVIDIFDSVSKQGSEENVKKYLKLLSEFFPDCLANLQILISKNDVDALRKELHKLKGALSLVTLPDLQKAVDVFNDRVKGKNEQDIVLLYENIVQQVAVFNAFSPTIFLHAQ